MIQVKFLAGSFDEAEKQQRDGSTMHGIPSYMLLLASGGGCRPFNVLSGELARLPACLPAQTSLF